MRKFILGFVCALTYLSAWDSRVHCASLASEDQGYFSRGINLSTGAFNPERNPAVYGKDYTFPTTQDLDYYASKGFSVVRLPYRWERLQPSLFGELDEAELARIKGVVDAARARNMRIILSPHNFGRYFLDGKEVLIGTTNVPISAFADFSNKVASAFAGDAAVYALSLMNEPHASQGLWKQTAQAGLDAIRAADKERLVLAPGDEWSSAHKWREYNEDFLLRDPANRVMYEAHQYFDLDHTGTYKVGYALNGASPERGVEWVRPFVEWLKLHQLKGIITEFGVPGDDPRWLELVDRLLVYLAEEDIPWTYWTGGPWYGDYPLSTERKNGVDAPIMSVLTKAHAMDRTRSRQKEDLRN
jgi:aryl-phospho-beta-D-glucosidase BglC (GH1 family)